MLEGIEKEVGCPSNSKLKKSSFITFYNNFQSLHMNQEILEEIEQEMECPINFNFENR